MSKCDKSRLYLYSRSSPSRSCRDCDVATLRPDLRAAPHQHQTDSVTAVLQCLDGTRWKFMQPSKLRATEELVKAGDNRAKRRPARSPSKQARSDPSQEDECSPAWQHSRLLTSVRSPSVWPCWDQPSQGRSVGQPTTRKSGCQVLGRAGVTHVSVRRAD